MVGGLNGCPCHLKCRFYSKIMHPRLLLGLECCAVNISLEQKIKEAQMIMPGYMSSISSALVVQWLACLAIVSVITGTILTHVGDFIRVEGRPQVCLPLDWKSNHGSVWCK